jgi:hypothetical protein
MRSTAFFVNAALAHPSCGTAQSRRLPPRRGSVPLTVTLCVMPSRSLTETRHFRGATGDDTTRFFAFCSSRAHERYPLGQAVFPLRTIVNRSCGRPSLKRQAIPEGREACDALLSAESTQVVAGGSATMR